MKGDLDGENRSDPGTVRAPLLVTGGNEAALDLGETSHVPHIPIRRT
jgi:hypothetical protein